MTELRDAPGESVTATLYQRANEINARLASKLDPSLADEGRNVVLQLLDHVREQVDDYEDFVRRVDRAELFSIHDSAQVPKKEKGLRTLYLRAVGLQETIEDAEDRARQKRRT